MIKKPTIIVTSLGRTGTKFFHTLFRELLVEGTSLHEPDVLNISQYQGTRYRLDQVFKQTKESGIFNLLVRRPLGQWSLIELSDARFKRQISYKEVVQKILKQREHFVNSCSGSIYVESSIAYYGIIDVLKDAFEQHAVAYIVRDGRDWIRSWMSWSEGGGMYDKSKIRGLFAHTWPTAAEIKGDPYEKKWSSMTRFAKLCWGWARLNEYAFRTIEKNPNARVFRFEDIFYAKNRSQNLRQMVRFLTENSGYDSISVESLYSWLDQKIHKSPKKFPDWEGWPKENKKVFKKICAPLMEKLGYDFD